MKMILKLPRMVLTCPLAKPCDQRSINPSLSLSPAHLHLLTSSLFTSHLLTSHPSPPHFPHKGTYHQSIRAPRHHHSKVPRYYNIMALSTTTPQYRRCG